MKGYEIYLTRSVEVASLIAQAKRNVGHPLSVSYGVASEKGCIPAIYHNQGYFACCVEYETEEPFCDIVFA